MDDLRLPSVRAGVKHHIDPIVCGLVRVYGKGAGVAVDEHSVRAPRSVHRRMQRSTIHSSIGKVTPVGTVMPCRGEVRGYVQRICGDRYRVGEIHLLPTGRRLSCECRRGEQGSGIAP